MGNFQECEFITVIELEA